MPAKTVGQKILKQRLIRNIERKDFAKMINAEKKTVELWELHGLVPAAKSIKKICDLFELPLEYFGKYYAIYFKKPEELFMEWKNRHGYSYSDCVSILECSRSALITFVRGDYGLSYDMYLKMKEVGVF
jgi:transcriptional regulator with XRE-family HTH domain